MGDYLNVGCGSRYAPGWINIDFNSVDTAVRALDLSHGIPYPDDHFDVVYHSHVLEHLPREGGAFLLRECHRVLRPGGVIRVVVPDLELLARSYLRALEAARAAAPNADADHEWAVIHLIDQLVRHQSGGEMLRYIAQANLPNLDYVVATWGAEASAVRSRLAVSASRGARERVRVALRGLAHAFREGRVASELRVRLSRIVLGGRGYAGWFRMRGEVHQWMYDYYSLARLLDTTGFQRVYRCTAGDSGIDGWAGFCLDTEADGSPYRPDSLYMEASKAGST
jgi:SAM-dependent methyltransferase